MYRLPASSSFSKSFSVFLAEFNFFLSIAATTPHEFIITGDFNIHLDNTTDHLISQFLSVLSSFNLAQLVNFPTHNKNHILDLVITSSDSSLAPSLTSTLSSPSKLFLVFTCRENTTTSPTLHSIRCLYSMSSPLSFWHAVISPHPSPIPLHLLVLFSSPTTLLLPHYLTNMLPS